MNYRHIYHAGSFADVFKHIILICLLESLQKKDKAFCYLDTHAGIGTYDLQQVEAQKTQEYHLGIEKILQQTVIPYAEIQTYLDIVKSLNTDQQLRYYPGSPYIARHLLRPQDRMIISELHPDDFFLLKQEFRHDPQVAIHHQDAYLAMKAFLPPPEKRGLVLIDPPYEKTNELEQIIKSIELALKRWAGGIYAIWYPIKDKVFHEQLQKKLRQLTDKEILFAELSIPAEDPLHISLSSTGVAIINPPWQLDQKLAAITQWLSKVFAQE